MAIYQSNFRRKDQNSDGNFDFVISADTLRKWLDKNTVQKIILVKIGGDREITLLFDSIP